MVIPIITFDIKNNVLTTKKLNKISQFYELMEPVFQLICNKSVKNSKSSQFHKIKGLKPYLSILSNLSKFAYKLKKSKNDIIYYFAQWACFSYLPFNT